MICSPVAQSTKSMLQRNVRQFTHILISMLHCATAHEEGILWANISISDNMYGTTRHRSTKRKIGKEEGINRVYNDLEKIVCLHVVSSAIVGVCTQCTAHLNHISCDGFNCSRFFWDRPRPYRNPRRDCTTYAEHFVHDKKI